MKKRYKVLDVIRGIALINMIAFHAIWDMVYLFDVEWQWFRSDISYIWQQGICRTFIFLSGFSWSLGRNQLRRGITVFMGGALISLVTAVFVPDSVVWFGVLTLLGTCMMFMVPLHKILQKVYPAVGCVISVLLFTVTRNVNEGYVGSAGWKLWELPKSWYCNMVTAYLGCPPQDFYSTDYFSIFPWIFLFAAGYFTYRFCENKKMLPYLERCKLPVSEWLGRHSLVIYMLHQPVIYAALSVVFYLARR